MSAPAAPSTDFDEGGTRIHESGEWIWVPLREQWADVTHKPEERVRQEWVRRLVVDGGYSLGQMDQERRLIHGTGSPRADIVVWPSVADKTAGASAALIIETKATDGPVILSDFRQGESYARAGGSEFLVAATSSAHSVYQLIAGFPGHADEINLWPRLHDLGDAARLAELKRSLRTFDRDEFQKLLYECHSLLRDHHAMTPDRAFDTISKILFIKLYIERQGNHGTFTTEFLRDREKIRLAGDPPVHDLLFNRTKDVFRADGLFEEDDRLDISNATFRELVSKLQRFNLSNTGDDVKGIAFERFLGRTFRGELGQFFTPRPVVDFIVDVLDPAEGELICDPAAGSGGFLIRAFEHVRSKIFADVEREKNAAYEEISLRYADRADDMSLADRDREIDEAFARLNQELVTTTEGGRQARTRAGKLAWTSIFGSDKEPRAARTAKMNMIMHGDGHGGIHWHDGLVSTNGIFAGRFDVVVTNPPFGATVSSSQLVGGTTESDVSDDADYKRQQIERYGKAWKKDHDRVVNARAQPILSLFEIGAGKRSRQTETLFVERCLALLRPGGRLAIVLPNGNLNSASLAWLRRWVEGKAYLRAVVALPVETFKFSKASVSASIVVLKKFTAEDTERWESCWSRALEFTHGEYEGRRAAVVADMGPRLHSADNDEVQSELLGDLAAIGIERVLEGWTITPPAGIDRGIGQTRLGRAKWGGSTTSTKRAAELKTAYIRRSAELKDVISRVTSTINAQLRSIDVEQTAAMWAFVREEFDYPVFMATPKAVGITASGDTGAAVSNDLPDVLAGWREFQAKTSSGEQRG